MIAVIIEHSFPNNNCNKSVRVFVIASLDILFTNFAYKNLTTFYKEGVPYLHKVNLQSLDHFGDKAPFPKYK